MAITLTGNKTLLFCCKQNKLIDPTIPQVLNYNQIYNWNERACTAYTCKTTTR